MIPGNDVQISKVVPGNDVQITKVVAAKKRSDDDDDLRFIKKVLLILDLGLEGFKNSK